MFKIEFKIVSSEYDDFVGQNGFFKISCNDFSYGEIFSEELEQIMDKVSVLDWIERLIKVLEHLKNSDYVALSDTESYNTWIEFKKLDDQLVVSIRQAQKEDGSRDIEYKLNNATEGDWKNQIVSFQEVKDEVITKAQDYLAYVYSKNENKELFRQFESKIERLYNFE
ncbi:hypothetical protein [Anaerotignum sp.]|uniref:hypothetical protein n=1 Tax=Anaerotignum sp. TaxID=2039241 RepID=UPI00289AA7BA|nr:hypothetical protein [Anaerotignum sp.]